MGSHLYSREQVLDLLAGADLELADVAHDFVVPYGVYRNIPDSVAARLRTLDTALVGTAPGARIASVSYWHAAV